MLVGLVNQTMVVCLVANLLWILIVRGVIILVVVGLIICGVLIIHG